MNGFMNENLQSHEELNKNIWFALCKSDANEHYRVFTYSFSNSERFKTAEQYLDHK